MKQHHAIFSLPRPLFWLLLISNAIYAAWLNAEFGSFWGWNIVDLANQQKFELDDLFAVGQFVLLGITLDAVIRHFVVSFNKTNENRQIPAIFVQAVTIVSYGVVALFAFIGLYDHSASQILAASGALGFGIAYVLREMISDIVACIQIQSEGLLSIGDFIQLKGGDYYLVKQLDARRVVLQDSLGFTFHTPNRQFVNQNFINISKQDPNMGMRLALEVEVDSGNDPSQVLELLEQAAQFVIQSETGFFSWYRTRFIKINNGTFSFLLLYECDTSMSVNASKTIMSLAVTRFLKLGGINMNSTMETSSSSEVAHTIKSRLRNLYRLGVLRVLSLEEVNCLSESATVSKCRAGEYLIEKGQQAESMYFLVEGELEVTIPNELGEEVVVGSIWPGDCVGEMSLLTGEPRSANVRAKSNSTLLEITKAAITPIFAANPELINEISIILERRKAQNQMLLNKPIEPEELENGIKLLAKKILSFFFNKG
jgi:CRP-like cAMP-binding protein/small-conductance mechanosensitive channel